MSLDQPKFVLIESPYKNGDRNRNLRYLAWCEYDAAQRGEYPISSHGNCTAYWPEDDEHRAKGFAWRNAMAAKVDLIAFYIDLGMSEGAQEAYTHGQGSGHKVEQRGLHPRDRGRFEAGEYPPGSMRRIAVPIEELIDRSSLGTPEVKQAIAAANIDPAVVQKVLDRADELHAEAVLEPHPGGFIEATVSSSNIRSIRYNPESTVLEIKFATGGVYQYTGVPRSEYDAMMKAESKGKYLQAHIKNVYQFVKMPADIANVIDSIRRVPKEPVDVRNTASGPLPNDKWPLNK